MTQLRNSSISKPLVGELKLNMLTRGKPCMLSMLTRGKPCVLSMLSRPKHEDRRCQLVFAFNEIKEKFPG